MAEFPTTETGMAQLSSRMQQGYGAYPALFVQADLPGLQAAHEPNAECGVRNAEYEEGDCGVRNSECGVRNGW